MLFFKSKPKPAPQEPFFPWNPADFSVGVTRFDEDHQRLGDLLNRIHGALTHRRDRVEAAHLLERLLQEARDHFAKEEAALQATDYPDAEEHIAEHQLLLREGADLLRQFQAGSISGLAFPNFLKHWLIGHIKDSDRKYAVFLRRKGMR